MKKISKKLIGRILAEVTLIVESEKYYAPDIIRDCLRGYSDNPTVSNELERKE